MGIKTNKKRKVRGVPVNNITIKSAPREKRKVTNSLVTEARVNIYLGTYIFFIRPAFCITDESALVLALLIKEKSMYPIRRYTGKYLISDINKFEKTITITIMIRRGLSTLHK